MGKMSTLVFSHDNEYKYFKKGKKTVIKEKVRDGEKGLSFYFMKKVDESFYSISVRENENKKFNVLEKNGTDEKESEITEAEMKKMLKNNKKLDSQDNNFGKIVLNYLSKERKKYSAKAGKKTVIKEKVRD